MSQKFTFHIPNLFPRDSQQPESESESQYSQLPTTSNQDPLVDALVDRDEQRLVVERQPQDRHGMPHTQFGVDSTLSWKRKSNIYKTFIWLAFGTLGAAVLLPFNALITPSEYYRSVLATTPYARSFTSWIILVYNVATISVGAVATATLEKTTPAKRISISSIIILISLISFTIYTSRFSIPLPTSSSTSISTSTSTSKPESNHFFPLLITLTLVLASSTAFLQSSVVGLCASFGGGGKAMGSMLSGQGLVAVALSLVQLMASLNQISKEKVSDSIIASTELRLETESEPESNQAQRTARTFFASSSIFMFLALITFFWLIRTEVYNEIESRRIESNIRAKEEQQKRDRGNDALLSGDDDDEEDDDEEEEEARVERNSQDQQKDILPNFISRRISSSSRDYLNRMWRIQSKVLISSLTICLVFTLTLGVFPALTSRVQSTSTASIIPPIPPPSSTASSSTHQTSSASYLSNPLFFTSLHFLLFNLSDLIGRSLPSIKPSIFLLKSFKVALISSLFRFLFIPLLRSCNLRPNPTSNNQVETEGAFSLLSTDAAFFILLVFLGLSNGIISTSIFVIGPGERNQRLKNDERPLAASILSNWLTFGLALGSVSSFWIAR